MEAKTFIVTLLFWKVQRDFDSFHLQPDSQQQLLTK